jgi:hypothetical protein
LIRDIVRAAYIYLVFQRIKCLNLLEDHEAEVLLVEEVLLRCVYKDASRSQCRRQSSQRESQADDVSLGDDA